MKKSMKTKMDLPPFKRGNLVEMVFNALKNEILSGKFKRGEKLASQEIFCKEMGVSRTVVREAWNKLASLGLIQRFLEDYTKIPGTSQRAISYHKRIIQSVAKKDSDLAEAEMKEHLMDVINTLRETLDLTLDL